MMLPDRSPAEAPKFSEPNVYGLKPSRCAASRKSICCRWSAVRCSAWFGLCWLPGQQQPQRKAVDDLSDLLLLTSATRRGPVPRVTGRRHPLPVADPEQTSPRIVLDADHVVPVRLLVRRSRG